MFVGRYRQVMFQLEIPPGQVMGVGGLGAVTKLFCYV